LLKVTENQQRLKLKELLPTKSKSREAESKTTRPEKKTKRLKPLFKTDGRPTVERLRTKISRDI
jgi:hypothetical protein